MEKALDKSGLLGEGLEEEITLRQCFLNLHVYVYGLSCQEILLKAQILVSQACSGCQMVRLLLLLAHKPHLEKLGAGISNSIALEA